MSTAGRLALLLGALLAACAGKSAADGAAAPVSPHPADFVLVDGQTYEKNPDVKLAREYWIIGVAKDGTRFMLPRPDGDRRIVEECSKKGPLAALFEGAQLCTSATQASLARVNALTAAEARQVSTFLHARLRFEVEEGPNVPPHVDPYPLTSDLLDICRTYRADRDGVLRATCDHLLGNEMSSSGAPEIGHTLSLEECRIIATRLNELYGIP
jgi:hypothetical protein